MSTFDFATRFFRPADGPAVLELFQTVYQDAASNYFNTDAGQQFFADFLDSAAIADLHDIDGNYITRPGSNFWVAESDRSIIGCLGVYQRVGGESEIRRIAVSAAVLRRGIATRLMDQAEAFCRAAGHQRLVIWVENHLAAGIKFCENRGYQPIEEHTFPHTGLVLYLYSLDL